MNQTTILFYSDISVSKEDQHSFIEILNKIQSIISARMRDEESFFRNCPANLVLCSLVNHVLINFFINTAYAPTMEIRREMAEEIYRELGVMFFDSLERFETFLAPVDVSH